MLSFSTSDLSAIAGIVALFTTVLVYWMRQSLRGVSDKLSMIDVHIRDRMRSAEDRISQIESLLSEKTDHTDWLRSHAHTSRRLDGLAETLTTLAGKLDADHSSATALTLACRDVVRAMTKQGKSEDR